MSALHAFLQFVIIYIGFNLVVLEGHNSLIYNVNWNLYREMINKRSTYMNNIHINLETCTFCPNAGCPCQSEHYPLQRARCQPGFPRLTGGPDPRHLHPRFDGPALIHYAALHQSGRCPPDLSACWHLNGFQNDLSAGRCRCVDCVARPHCRLQTAPIR